jgi:hypothetical protein
MVKEGYDPQFGARPLKRVIQEQVLNPLLMCLLEGDLSGSGSCERNLSRFVGRRPPGRASGRERVNSNPACRAEAREGGAINSRSWPKAMDWYWRRNITQQPECLSVVKMEFNRQNPKLVPA